MPMADMGRDFAGAMASSHAFLSLSVSISSGVVGLRVGAKGCLEDVLAVRCCYRSVQVREGWKRAPGADGGNGLRIYDARTLLGAMTAE